MRTLLAFLALLTPTALWSQASNPAQEIRRQAIKLDGSGKGAEARVIWQRLIDSAPEAPARAAAQRRMAMSWGFEGNCTNASVPHNGHRLLEDAGTRAAERVLPAG
jgi:hypothetical protein